MTVPGLGEREQAIANATATADPLRDDNKKSKCNGEKAKCGGSSPFDFAQGQNDKSFVRFGRAARV
jgi:hypothetical protein